MFISIKWKAVIFLSVALIFLTGVWIWQTIDNRISWYEKQQLNQGEQAQLILQQIITDHFLQLSAVVQLLPSQGELLSHLTLPHMEQEHKDERIDELWFQMGLNLGADYLGIFNNEKRLIIHRYNDATISSLSNLGALIETRIQNQEDLIPDNFIYCDIGCMQVVLEPVLLSDASQVYVVLGKNMEFKSNLVFKIRLAFCLFHPNFLSFY